MSTLDFRSHFLALIFSVWRSYFLYLGCVHVFIRIEDQLLCQKSLLNFYEAKVSLIDNLVWCQISFKIAKLAFIKMGRCVDRCIAFHPFLAMHGY